MALVSKRQREIHKAAVVESDIFDGSVFACLDALAKQAYLLLVRVGTLIRGRENALDSDLLLGIVKEIGHPLRPLDHRKRELRLSGRVVGGGEIPQPDELVLRRKTLLQSLEQWDRPFWAALLEESASLQQRVLRRRR